MVKISIEGYPEHIHAKEKMADHKNSNSTKKLNISILGVGGLGSAIAHYFIVTLPNVNVHLAGREKQTESIEARVRSLIARHGKGDITEEEEAKKRIRIYQTTTGETTKNAKGETIEKERFLDSDFLIISARDNSVPFSAFKSRLDEYGVNVKLIKENIGPRINGYKGIVIPATGPLELISEELATASGIPLERIVGASYIDTIRFRKELQREIYNVTGNHINLDKLEKAIVLGARGANMVQIYSRLKINGEPFNSWSPLNKDRDGIRKRIANALSVDPIVIQFAGSTAVNVDDPALAIYEMINCLYNDKEITGSVHDGKCFISYPCRAKTDEKGLKVISFDKKILAPVQDIETRYLSEKERKKVVASKEEIIELKRKIRLMY